MEDDWGLQKEKEKNFFLERSLLLYKELMKKYFFFHFMSKKDEYRSLKEIKELLKKCQCPIVANSAKVIYDAFEVLCGCKAQAIGFNNFPEKADLVVLHGLRMNYIFFRIAMESDMRCIPLFFSEDGFIRSIEPVDATGDEKYRRGHSLILDDSGMYIFADRSSYIERFLNSEICLGKSEVDRVHAVIKKIRSEKLSKYNHQPIYDIKRQEKGKVYVLVIDQVPGDKSIEFGWANENTFSLMLQAAIDENPNAKIIIKTHPAQDKGHYYHLKHCVSERICYIDFDINPIALIESVDKVYVCTSQMGFEAVLCGKEVHVFGMPFYAGWGVTRDRKECYRRSRKRTIKEIFYAAYIQCTLYVSYKSNSNCEIEQAIDEILELREEYFKRKEISIKSKKEIII